MPLLQILKFPDPALKSVSAEIREFTPELAKLAADMKETMLAAPGAGLAAPQVGRLIRLITVEASEEEEDYGASVLTLVNPEIVLAEGELIFEEGCLSVDDYRSNVKRFNHVQVRAQDIQGQPITIDYEGRRAVILQHEIDHLDGVLFIDRLSRLKREMYKKSLRRRRRTESKNKE
jgi:peptide deformylase